VGCGRKEVNEVGVDLFAESNNNLFYFSRDVLLINEIINASIL